MTKWLHGADGLWRRLLPVASLVVVVQAVVPVLAGPSASLNVAPSRARLYADGSTQQLLVTVPEDDRELGETPLARYETSDPSVATVSSNGLVRGHRAGTAVIRVVVAG
ncbi:MAG: Ig-like domain-containing protein, partial [Planctomycetes bacterium]|nr:Ig-like domain-containing protein [Planctomycetota bacterium]